MPLRCTGAGAVGGQAPGCIVGPGQHPMPLKVEVASLQMAVQPII